MTHYYVIISELDGDEDTIRKRGHPNLLSRSDEVSDETTHNLVYTPPKFDPTPNSPMTNLRYQQAYAAAVAEVVSFLTTVGAPNKGGLIFQENGSNKRNLGIPLFAVFPR